MIQFLKNWTLPIAMLVGTVAYLLFARVEMLAPAKPFIHALVSFITPWLIFIQLLLTFCKVELQELKPKAWHGWLLGIQAATCLLTAAVLLFMHTNERYVGLWEGMMVCFICPTATAAAVITGKLGGNAATLITYTLLSNLLGAVMVPLLFPLVEPHEGLSFWNAFSENTEQGISPAPRPLLSGTALALWSQGYTPMADGTQRPGFLYLGCSFGFSDGADCTVALSQ